MLKTSTQLFLSLSIPILFFSMELLSGLFSEELPPVTAGGDQIEVSVSSSTDDAKENSSGSINLTSNGVNAGIQNSNIYSGFRFQSVVIPKDAKIIAAYIEFRSHTNNSTAAAISISGHNVDDAPTFSSTDKVSTRQKTTSSVDWTPSAWVKGDLYKSANFNSVVQEIVNRDNWASGNDMAILFEGTGLRMIESFDKADGVPAKLVVVYDDTTPALTKTASYIQNDNYTEFFSFDPDPNCSGADWATGWTKFECPNGFKVDEYSDGSRILYGTIVNDTDNNDRWDVYMRLKEPKTWTEWDALGRMYYESAGGGNCTADHVDWLYYEIDSTVSRIMGTTGYDNEGNYSKILHSPGDISKGVQTGFGANNCGGACSCQTNDIRGWCEFSGDLERGCVDFGLVIMGYDNTDACSIFNGDFESGTTEYWFNNDLATLSITNDAHTGSHAVLLTGDHDALTYDYSEAVPGYAYLISGYGKVSGSPGWTAMQLRFYDLDRNELGKINMELNQTSWQLLNGGAIAPAGTASLGISLYKGVGGTATFDDICLKIVPNPNTGSCDGITNNGFESTISTEWSPFGSVTQTTDNVEGTYAALLGGGVNSGISTSASAVGGQVYSLDFWIKQSGSNSWVGAGVEFYDASWNYLSGAMTDNFATSWESRNISATAPAGTAHVNYWVNKNGSGNLYIDAVCLKGLVITEICDDGIDNDDDGLTDCNDPDCSGDSSCSSSCMGNNLGFENSFTNWTVLGSVTTSSDAYVGSASAFLNADAERLRQDFSIDGDSLYQLSFYSKGTNSNSSDWTGIALKFYDSGGTKVGQQDIRTIGYTNWQHFFKLVHTPENAVTMTMELAVWGSSTTSYFDEICFQKSSYSVPQPSCSGCEMYSANEGESTVWFENASGWVVHDLMEGAVICDNGDGTMTIQATLLNGRYETTYPCGDLDGWELEVTLNDKQDWTAWGGAYDDFGITNLPCTDYHTDWDYWEISGGTLTGIGCNAGSVHNILGNVSGYRIQVGEGANRNSCNFGLAGWIEYDLNGSTESFDLYLDIDETCYNSTSEIWLEPECATVGANWNTVTDATASGGEYVTIQGPINAYNSPPTSADDHVTFNINATQAGNFNIFGRVLTPSGNDDSFWVRVNNGTWYKWNNIGTNTSWTWVQVHDADNGNSSVSFPITVGANTIDFAYREDGALLDKIVLTEGITAPTGSGQEAENCNLCNTLNVNGGFEDSGSVVFNTTYNGIPAASIAPNSVILPEWMGLSSFGSTNFYYLNDNSDQVNNTEGDKFILVDEEGYCMRGVTDMVPDNCYEIIFDAAFFTSGSSSISAEIKIEYAYPANPTLTTIETVNPTISTDFNNMTWVTYKVPFTPSATDEYRIFFTLGNVSGAYSGGMVLDNVIIRECCTIEEICDNGIDDDGDGYTDNEDSDCINCPTGSISYERWTGISGSLVTDLTGNANFPDSPSETGTFTSFEGPTNYAENYGTRVRGFIHPQETGNFIFTVTSDDGSEVYLSTDDSPANKVKIAEIVGWTGSTDFTKYPSQTSASIPLISGERYYIEMLHKEGGGGDNLALYWQTPSNTTRTVIQGTYLSPWGCSEICDNGIDDDGDTTTDCADADCSPTNGSFLKTNPGCQVLNNGQITITATGENLEYSIDNGATYQSSNTFNNLMQGVYTVLVRNSVTGCTLSLSDFGQSTVTLVNENCPEICGNGIDDDGDGTIDNPSECPTDTCSARVTNGLVALYNFKEATGTVVRDVSNVGVTQDLIIQDPANTSWIGDCGLSIFSETTLETTNAAHKITDSLKASNALTIEAWINPLNVSQSGPARIVTLSQDAGNRNFTLGQSGSSYNIRLRTTSGTSNGYPSTDVGTATPGVAQHVVLTWDGATGAEKLYIDGVEVHSDTRGGDLSNWDDTYRLAVANEFNDSRNWKGGVYMVAIYNRALSPSEINTNYSQLPCCVPIDYSPHFDCAEGVEIETIYTGLQNDIPKTFNVSNTTDVDSIVLEIVYKSGNPGTTISVTDAGANTYNATRQDIGNSAYLYRFSLPATSSITYSNTSNENRAQSMIAYVFRSNQPGKMYASTFAQISSHNSLDYLNFKLPVRTDSQDLKVYLPISEVTYDNRDLDFTVTAGDQSTSKTVLWGSAGQGFPDGCCMDIVELEINNLAPDVQNILVEIDSRSGGQSYVVSGYVWAEVICLEEICGNGIDDDFDGLTDCADDDCPKPIVNVFLTRPSCAGNTDGALNLTISGGGSGPYQIDWDNNGTGDTDDPEDLTNLGTGTYSVTVTNSTGCSASETVVLGYEEQYPYSAMILTGANSTTFPTGTYAGGYYLTFPTGSDNFDFTFDHAYLPSQYQIDPNWAGAGTMSYQMSDANTDSDAGHTVQDRTTEYHDFDPGTLLNNSGRTYDVYGRGHFYFSGGSDPGGHSWSTTYDFTGLANGYLPAGTLIGFVDIDGISLNGESVLLSAVLQSGGSSAWLGGTPYDYTDFAGQDAQTQPTYNSGANTYYFNGPNSTSTSSASILYQTTQNLTSITMDLTHGTGGSYGMKFMAPVTLKSNSVASTNPTPCELSSGTITVTAYGDSLEYSINNGASFQDTFLFENLAASTYQVLVRNENTLCEVYSTSVVLGSDPCDENCVGGIDEDGDMLIDCDDPDCFGLSIDNIAVGSCINQPLSDVAIVNATISWINAPAGDDIVVTIDGKSEIIDVSTGAVSPQVVSFLVPADGSSNVGITASWKNTTGLCSDSDAFNVPSACSNDEISCNILYLCGTNKFQDAEPWDHGMVEYFDAVNGTNSLTAALTKADLGGVGLYDVNNSSSPLSINFSDYDLIVVSPSVGSQIAPDLIDTLKQFSGGILNMERRISDDLGMSSGEGAINSGDVVYYDNSNSFVVYNYDNPTSIWNIARTVYSYNAGGDVFLWENAGDQASGADGIFMFYDESDGLPGIPSHGDRVQLGYHMDGFYYNPENGGATPTTPDQWFDPVKHLTLEGKLYLDSAIVLAASSCGAVPEICNDGIDNDLDGNADCLDPDCQGSISVISDIPFIGCSGGGSQINLTASGTSPFAYIWSDMDADARWTFESTLDDFTGNGYNENGGNTATITYSNDAVEGQESLQFDGDDYLRYSVDGLFMESAFTQMYFSAWIKPTDLTGVKTIFEEGSASVGIGLRLNESQLQGSVASGSVKFDAGEVTFPNDGAWHLVALTFDNGDLRIYVDGSGGSVTTASYTSVGSHSGNGGLGYQDNGSAFGAGSGNNYSGLMDDVRISHSGALSANQVIDLARNDGDRFHLEDGTYDVTVTNAANCVDSEVESVLITNYENVTIGGSISADQTICSGETPSSFISMVDASGGNGLTIEYEWESSTDGVNWNTIGGAVYSTYTSSSLTQTTYFRRGAARTNCPNKVYTNTLTVTVVENITSPGTISGDETRCGSYDPAEIASVTVASGGLGGTVEYQWQISTDGANFSDVSGAIAESLDPPTITQTTYYRRGARRAPCAVWDYSNVIVKTLVTNFTNGGIVSDDESNCGSFDPAPITESNAATGGSGGPVEYVWEQNIDGAGWTVISGVNAESYDPPFLTQTTEFRRGARRGPCTALIYSNSVIKEVTGASLANITTYPTTTMTHFCEDTDYTFAAADAGVGATYSWDFGAYATPSTATGQGPHTVVFDVPNNIPGTTFDVSLTTDLASCQDVDVKSFSVRPPLSITNIDTEDPSACGGTTGEIDVTVNSPSGWSYQVSIDGGITWGVNNQSLFTGLPAGTYQIQVRYGDTGACPEDYGVVTLNDPFLPTSGILANYTDECLDQTFEYSALFSFFIGAYDWDFGEGATPATASGIGPHNVTYSSPGNKVVTLTISGFGCSKDYSDLFVVSSNYTDGGSIDGDQDLCGSFDPAEISSTAVPTGGTGGTGGYQWEYRIQDGVGGWDEWIDITGATDASYDPPTILEPTQMRRKARRNPCSEWLPTNEITLTPAGQPTANPISFTTVCPGQPHGEDLSINDVNLVNPTFSIYTQPANGTLSVFSDGQFLYDPNSTFCGTDEFVYEVCNFGGTCCDTARVTLNLTDNTAPTLYNIPADVTIACDEQVPLPPSVLAIENCLSVSLGLDEISTQGIDNCALYDYQITRIWTATDYCGNGASDSQIITIEDNTAPDIYRVYTLPNGKKMVAGVMENVTTRWKQIALPITFTTAPVIFTQTTTAADGSAAAVQLRNVSKSQFEMQLIEEEAGDGEHVRESVAWIAIEEGVQSNEMPFEVGLTTVSSALKNVSFMGSYSTPGIIASAQTALEEDPVGLRISGLTGSFVNIQLQEEASADGETAHAFENLGYLVFNEPGDFTLTGGEVIGETGTVSATDAWTTVSLSNNYKNPVVIANAPSNNDTAPVLVSVKDVTESEFKIKLTEWDYLDGSHAIEEVHYFVVEGSIPLDDEVACDMLPATLGINTELIAVDNCDLAITLEFEETPATKNCAPGNEVIRTWSATDECGNTTSISRILTLIDTVAPEFTPPVDLTVACLDDIDDLSLTGDVFDESDNCTTGLEATYVDTYPSSTDCGEGFTVERNWTLEDGCGNETVKTQNIFVISVGIRIQLKMMLQGAIFGITPGDSLMRDDLREKGLLPTEEPYSNIANFDHKATGGGETADSSVFDVTGTDAIVDWIFVEIRHDSILDSVLATRSALLQRDGDIVDTDGFSPVFFPTLAPGMYNVAIRHRNHLGAMTGSAKAISDDPDMSFTDFTTNADTLRANMEVQYECADFDGDGKMLICKEDGTTLEIAAGTWESHQMAGAVCGPCADFETIAAGAWSDGSIWSGGAAPPETLSSGQKIVVRHNLIVNSTVLVEGNSILWVENGSLDINGGLIVKDGEALVRGSVISLTANVQLENDASKLEMVGSTLNVDNNATFSKGLAYFEATCLDVAESIVVNTTSYFVRSRVDIANSDFTVAMSDSTSVVYNIDSKFHLIYGDFMVDGGFHGEVDAIWLENGHLINEDSDDIGMGTDTTTTDNENLYPCEDYDNDGQIMVCRSGTSQWVTTVLTDDVCGPCGMYKTIADGEWNDASTWEGGNVPPTGGAGAFEVVINHQVTHNQTISVQNGSMVWIEAGSLTVTGNNKKLQITDGTVAVRSGDLDIQGEIRLADTNARLEMIGSRLFTDKWVRIQSGNAHFEESNLDIDEDFWLTSGASATFVNSCTYCRNDLFENFGGTVHSDNSSFRIGSGDFNNEGDFTGTISALSIENGDLVNSSNWSVNIDNYCISGVIGIAPGFLPATENCGGITSLLESCSGAGFGNDGYSGESDCIDPDGDGQFHVCQNGTTTALVSSIGANEVCGPCGEFRTISDGDWNSNSTWEGGNKPGYSLAGDEVVVNHNVTSSSDIIMGNNSFLWIENGTLTITGSNDLELYNGELYVRDGTLDVGNKVLADNKDAYFELVNSSLTVGDIFEGLNVDLNWINSFIEIGEGMILQDGSGIFDGSAIKLNNGNFEMKGGNVNSNNGSFEVTNGNFVNETNFSGSVRAIWIANGSLDNSGSWTASITEYCADSGISGISGTYLENAENCAGIASIISDFIDEVNNAGTGGGDGNDSGSALTSWLATIANYCVGGDVTGIDTTYLPASQDCGTIASVIDACDCTTIVEDSEVVYMDTTMATTAVAPFGSNALLQTQFGHVNWGADLNSDGFSIYQGPESDVTSIFIQVFTDPDNSENHFPNFIRQAYDEADYDMDGEVIYQGPGNDRAKLLFDVILRHPMNTYNLPNFIVPEQLPDGN